MNNYIDVQYLLEDMYYEPTTNGLTEEEALENKDLLRGIQRASAEINALTGNEINKMGFDTFPENEQEVIKQATGHLVIHYLADGLDWVRGQSSVSGGGASFAQSHPSDPEYIPRVVKRLLNSIGLWRPYVSINDTHQEKQGTDLGDGFHHVTWSAFSEVGIRKDKLTSSDDTIIVENFIPVGETQTWTDIKTNLTLLADTLIEKPDFNEQIIDFVTQFVEEHYPNYEEAEERIIKDLEENEEFRNSIANVIANDENFLDAIEAGMFDRLTNDEEFNQLIQENTKNAILSDEEYKAKLVDNLINETDLVDKIIDNLLANETFNNSVQEATKNALLEDEEWANKIAEKVPPMTQEQFDELLGNSNYTKPIYTGENKGAGVLIDIPKKEMKNGIFLNFYKPHIINANGWEIFNVYVDQNFLENSYVGEGFSYYFESPTTNIKFTIKSSNSNPNNALFNIEGDTKKWGKAVLTPK